MTERIQIEHVPHVHKEGITFFEILAIILAFAGLVTFNFTANKMYKLFGILMIAVGIFWIVSLYIKARKRIKAIREDNRRRGF